VNLEGAGAKEHSLMLDDVLAVLSKSLVQYHDLVVELLSKHEVQLKVSIAPVAKHHVAVHVGGNRLVKPLLILLLFNAGY
jgi:hypothetical protein